MNIKAHGGGVKTNIKEHGGGVKMKHQGTSRHMGEGLR